MAVRFNAYAIKKARKKRGLTQQELADKLGWEQTRISEVENGKLKLRMDRLEKIWKALGIKNPRAFFVEDK